MKFALLTFLTIATAAVASPVAAVEHLVRRDDTDPQIALADLTATVKTHTAIINKTLAILPNTTTTSSGNSSNGNITGEFNLIALALNSSSDTIANAKRSVTLFGRDLVDCNATCQMNVYTGLGSMTAEISYTMAACLQKNAVDIATAQSPLLTVVMALDTVTSSLSDIVDGIAGVVVQTLLAALGTDIGGALATFISPS